MAFKTNLIEPVQFGDIEELPVITQELKMRLDRIKLDSVSAVEQAIEVMSSAFPINKDRIAEYLRSPQMPNFELSRLRAYLTGGDAAVAAIDNSFNVAIEKAMKND